MIVPSKEFLCKLNKTPKKGEKSIFKKEQERSG
jgi:hypothetical protein